MNIDLACKLLDITLDNALNKSELKTAFRRKVLIHHPDKGGNTKTFLLIKEAYEFLEIADIKSELQKRQKQSNVPHNLNETNQTIRASSNAIKIYRLIENFNKIDENTYELTIPTYVINEKKEIIVFIMFGVNEYVIKLKDFDSRAICKLNDKTFIFKKSEKIILDIFA